MWTEKQRKGFEGEILVHYILYKNGIEFLHPSLAGYFGGENSTYDFQHVVAFDVKNLSGKYYVSKYPNCISDVYDFVIQFGSFRPEADRAFYKRHGKKCLILDALPSNLLDMPKSKFLALVRKVEKHIISWLAFHIGSKSLRSAKRGISKWNVILSIIRLLDNMLGTPLALSHLSNQRDREGQKESFGELEPFDDIRIWEVRELPSEDEYTDIRILGDKLRHPPPFIASRELAQSIEPN